MTADMTVRSFGDKRQRDTEGAQIMAGGDVNQLVELIERRHVRRGAAAQIYVTKRGNVVLDRAIGCARDALFAIYSASKPFPALLVHLLAERGQLKLDDPIARYWPEFAQNGKEAITIRHALQHRAGIPVAGGLIATAAHMHDWAKAVRDVERAKPRWPAGEVPAYHFMSYGFILGELVGRVSGRPIRAFLADELLKPLGLDDIHLGLPDHALPRAVPVIATHPSEFMNQWLTNRRRTRQCVAPAASVSSAAPQLARFYQMLVGGGALDGVRVMQPETIAAARALSSDGLDAFIKRRVRWAQGFQLGGPSDARDLTRLMGATSSPESFGHAGNASCVTRADPTRDLVVVYLSNLQRGIDRGIQHLGEISDAAIAAVG
jgi:CubicO group peptidase (beta-lactamase class C family)